MQCPFPSSSWLAQGGSFDNNLPTLVLNILDNFVAISFNWLKEEKALPSLRSRRRLFSWLFFIGRTRGTRFSSLSRARPQDFSPWCQNEKSWTAQGKTMIRHTKLHDEKSPRQISKQVQITRMFFCTNRQANPMARELWVYVSKISMKWFKYNVCVNFSFPVAFQRKPSFWPRKERNRPCFPKFYLKKKEKRNCQGSLW